MFLTSWNACLFVVVVQSRTVTAYHGSVWRCAEYFVIRQQQILDFTIWQRESKIILLNQDIVINELQIFK